MQADDEARDAKKVTADASRLPAVSVRGVESSKRRQVYLSKKAAVRAQKERLLTSDSRLLHTEQAGLLQPDGPLEQTLHVRQPHIIQHVDQATQAKVAFRLDLSSSNLHPYSRVSYSRSGRALLLASRKGHLCVTDWRKLTPCFELHLGETLRDAVFLHNDQFVATAQHNHAFIYDASGAQLHVLRHHPQPGLVLSLPHHLLLATLSSTHAPHSKLIYTDTTSGNVVSSHDYASRVLALAACNHAAINPINGVLHAAHTSGVVSLWSPVSPRPLARIFAQPGGASRVCVMPRGDSFVTAGNDGLVQLFDLRTYKTLHSWRLPAPPSALAVSQRGLIAAAYGANVQVCALPQSPAASAARLKNLQPYMTQTFSGSRLTSLAFCPYEDLLAVAHVQGMRSMLVPGAGEPTFDSTAPNPYQTRKQRREAEVRGLLDKLPPSTIVLDPSLIGSVDLDPQERLRELRNQERDANIQRLRNGKVRKRGKGRGKISKRVKRRENNVILAGRLETQDDVNEARQTAAVARDIREKDKMGVEAGTVAGSIPQRLPDALQRFLPRKK